MKNRFAATTVILSTFVYFAAEITAAGAEWIELPTRFGSNPMTMSTDGSSVIYGNGDEGAVRWSRQDGVTNVLNPGGAHGRVVEIRSSADGQVAVAEQYYGYDYNAYYRRFGGEARWLSSSGIASDFYDVSANGRVVVGTLGIDGALWRNGSPQVVALNRPGSASWTASYVTACSDKGNVAYGFNQDWYDLGYKHRLFRWTAAEGAVAIPVVFNGWLHSGPCSGNGKFAFGLAQAKNGKEQAYRWSEHRGLELLGSTGQLTSHVRYSSYDGRIAAGWAGRGTATDQGRTRRLIVWEIGEPAVDVGDFGPSYFGNYIVEVTGISRNGNIVVGYTQVGLDDVGFIWTRNAGLYRVKDVIEASTDLDLRKYKIRRVAAISENGRQMALVVSRGLTLRTVLVDLPDRLIFPKKERASAEASDVFARDALTAIRSDAHASPGETASLEAARVAGSIATSMLDPDEPNACDDPGDLYFALRRFQSENHRLKPVARCGLKSRSG